MGGDELIEYEEANWQELAEKYIQKHYDDWCQFVADEYSQHMVDYEPPEDYIIKEDGLGWDGTAARKEG